MSSYKLTYFDIAGLGETVRYLLSYAGINFVDNRITKDQWVALKPKTPLEQLPILEVDGKVLYQSNAIARFLGHKFNLLGSDEFEAFEVDATLETIGDLRQTLLKWFFIENAAEKAAAKEETFKRVDFFLGKLEGLVKKNGGYFVGGKLSAADIVFAGLRTLLSGAGGKDIVTGYPGLKALVEKVEALPTIKSYIAKRPKTDL